jgi:hypothetical protein
MTLTAVQLTMTTAPAKGAPGMLYDSSEVVDIIEKVAGEAIPFGAFVKIGTDGTCELPDSSAEVTGINRGVALHDPAKASGDGYIAGDLVAILLEGRVWIQPEAGETIAAYAVPFVRYTADANPVGGWRSDLDTNEAAVPQNMHMFSAATSGGMGVLQVGPVSSGPAGPTL